MALTKHPMRTWIWAAVGLLPFAFGWIKKAWISLDFVATVQSMPTDLAAFWQAWIVPIAVHLDRIPPWGWMATGVSIITLSFVADRHSDRIAAAIRKHRRSIQIPPVDTAQIEPGQSSPLATANETECIDTKKPVDVGLDIISGALISQLDQVIREMEGYSADGEKELVIRAIRRYLITILPIHIQTTLGKKEREKFEKIIEEVRTRDPNDDFLHLRASTSYLSGLVATRSKKRIEEMEEKILKIVNPQSASDTPSSPPSPASESSP